MLTVANATSVLVRDNWEHDGKRRFLYDILEELVPPAEQQCMPEGLGVVEALAVSSKAVK